VLLLEVLTSLGLREVFAYEKFRTVFVAAGQAALPAAPLPAAPQAVFDETPIGNYLELEGPAKWIDRVASRLGFSPRDYITATYRALYLQDCRTHGRKPRKMVFKRRKQQ
jgi:adenylate cyclase class 2